VSCLLITFSSSSALASLSRSITPISGRMYSWACSRSCSRVWAGTERVVAERRRLVMISPPYILKLITLRQPQGFLFFLGPQVPGGCDVSAGDWTVLAATSASRVRPALKLGSIYECRSKWRAALFIAISFAFLGPCYKKFCAFVNYLTLRRRKNVRVPIGKFNARRGDANARMDRGNRRRGRDWPRAKAIVRYTAPHNIA